MTKLSTILYHILSIILTGILFFLSFDSFDNDKSLLNNLIAFSIHNLPTILVVLIYIGGTKKPLIGAVGFITIGTTNISLISRILINEGIKIRFFLPITIFSFLPILIAFLLLLKWYNQRIQISIFTSKNQKD